MITIEGGIDIDFASDDDDGQNYDEWKGYQPAGPCVRLPLLQQALAGLQTEVPLPGHHHENRHAGGGYSDYYVDGNGDGDVNDDFVNVDANNNSKNLFVKKL